VTYFWRYDTPEGPRESPRADDQQEAESWLSENWRDLAEQGVDEATLFDGEDVVYGPMSLHS
jgi:hypothetical protein